jgi:hypothetical protein
MELNLNSLDEEVTGARRHEQPAPKRLRLRDVTAPDDEEDLPEWESSAPYEQYFDYSAYESRYNSPSLRTVRPESPLQNSVLTIEDDDKDECVATTNAKDSIPIFFHPGMFVRWN